MGPRVRGDDEIHVFVLATGFCPSFVSSFAPSQRRGRREDRVRAAPAVSCAIIHQRNAAHEHTGSAKTLRPSLRNGFTTYTCSPWRPGFLVTIISVMREHHRELDANPGASGPHAFAVRIGAERLATHTRPPQPVPTSVTSADIPSCGTGWVHYAGDLRPKSRIIL